MARQTAAQLRTARCRRGVPGEYDDVGAASAAVPSEGFASEAFDPIAINGAARGAARYDETETSVHLFIIARQNREETIRRTLRLLHDAREFAPARQPVAARKSLSARGERIHPLRGTALRGLSRDGDSAPCGLRALPSVHETREFDFALTYSAEMFFS